MDVFPKSKRSEIMSRIKGKGNSATELRFIKLMRKHKVTGWRRGYPLRGKPDFVFLENRVAVFLDGCFWHGCPIHWSCPSTNRAFWLRKKELNVRRDRSVNRFLGSRGWKIIRIWQHELKDSTRVIGRLNRMLDH